MPVAPHISKEVEQPPLGQPLDRRIEPDDRLVDHDRDRSLQAAVEVRRAVGNVKMAGTAL